jgi:hypothetical protein
VSRKKKKSIKFTAKGPVEVVAGTIVPKTDKRVVRGRYELTGTGVDSCAYDEDVRLPFPFNVTSG